MALGRCIYDLFTGIVVGYRLHHDVEASNAINARC